MENDLCFDNFNLTDFLKKESDSDSDIEEPIQYEQPPKHIICEKISELNEIQIKNKRSYKATEDVVKLMSEMPNSSIKLPNRKKTIDALTYKSVNYSILVICDKCNEMIENNSMCCGQTMKMDSKKNNFIVHFSVVQQIHNILCKHFNVIIDYLNRERELDVISDVDDGKVYRQTSEKNQQLGYNLLFTLNLDGAQIFKSSSKSLWPVQLYLNFLPPSMRFHHENIIVSTIYFGSKKPNMVNILYPLAREFDELNKHPITIYRNHELYNFLPMIIQCVCDLPARAEVQCLKGPTGRNGCSYCYQVGVPVVNSSNRTTIRYIKETQPSAIRTHKETLLISQKVIAKDFNSEKRCDIDGVKGQSAIFMFDYIDIIDSFPTDYMHNILLGIMKNLIEIWLGKKKFLNRHLRITKLRPLQNESF